MENLYSDKSYMNNYALSMVEILRDFYSNNEMIWFKRVRNQFFFIVVDIEKREIVETINRTMKNGIPMENNEYSEFIGELQDLLLMKREFGSAEKNAMDISINRFLEENEQLAEEVSLQIQLEDERFYDSPIWD